MGRKGKTGSTVPMFIELEKRPRWGCGQRQVGLGETRQLAVMGTGAAVMQTALKVHRETEAQLRVAGKPGEEDSVHSGMVKPGMGGWAFPDPSTSSWGFVFMSVLFL